METKVETRMDAQVLLAAHQEQEDAAPTLRNYKKVWSDEFRGPAGSLANRSNWEYKVCWDRVWEYNNEKQTYTDNPKHSHLTGNGELNIVPELLPQPTASGARWASARLECWHSWRCNPGEKMIFQAEIKLGNNPRQMGIWPAFWALGKVFRDNWLWPQCAEWDILEVVNGRSINHGTLHFSSEGDAKVDAAVTTDKYTRTVPFDRSKWHSFRFRVNRAPTPWTEETLTWLIDGEQFFQVKGADVANEAQWEALARGAFYPVLNVAVGGEFPDGVNGGIRNSTPTYGPEGTQDGVGSGMKVRYVAVYKSADK